MAWLAVDADNSEYIYDTQPVRAEYEWMPKPVGLISMQHPEYTDFIKLPKGSIRKLISKDLTWNDEPIEL